VVELLVGYRDRAGPDDPRPFPDHAPEVERDNRSVYRPRGDEPAVVGECGQAVLEHRATDGVEDDIGLELGDSLVVVGQRFGTELTEPLVLALACGGIDRRTEVATDVDRGLTGAAGARLDEQRVAAFEPTLRKRGPGVL